MRPIIWWIRRDLRLFDNQALTAVLTTTHHINPLFIVDPFFAKSTKTGRKRFAFLWRGLHELDRDLRERGGRLIVRHGDPVHILPQIVAETGATAVYATTDYSPYARQRDARVAERVQLHLVDGITVHHPKDVLKADGSPYTVFTPYSRRWKERPFPTHQTIHPPPNRITTPNIASDPIPTPDLDVDIPFVAGEKEALRRLTAFTSGENAPIFQYAEKRNLPHDDLTSKLSPYLRFGMISPRLCVTNAIDAMRRAPSKSARQGAEIWLNELIWREFFQTILYHFPQVARQSFRGVYDKIDWANDRVDFERWCNGRTGYPIVDAAMRQLQQTGWMHNRTRMIVASFLVKDLLIDWRWGERWFMQHLVDGDLAANNGGWQWSAGTGTDAAPYFRIFNPTTQSQKFDPNGAYIRKWVPELTAVPDKYIHEPSKMPHNLQKQIGVEIDKTYPAPIVDHKWARQRTLAAFKRAKEVAEQA